MTAAAGGSVDRGTLVVKDEAETAAPAETEAPFDPAKATVSDLSESLKKMARETGHIDDTIILK